MGGECVKINTPDLSQIPFNFCDDTIVDWDDSVGVEDDLFNREPIEGGRSLIILLGVKSF